MKVLFTNGCLWSHFHGWDVSKQAQLPEFNSGLESVEQILSEFNRTYTYDELVNKQYPKGLDTSKLEMFMVDNEFMRVFGVTKDEFAKFPVWKQQGLKRERGLF